MRRFAIAIILFLSCVCAPARAQENIIVTIAGKDTGGFSGDGGPAIAAKLYFPVAIASDRSGNLYIADVANNRIRRIDGISKIITTIAGNDSAGYNSDGIVATASELFFPTDVFLDTAQNIYIADALNNRVRKISATTGIISTIAGTGVAGYSGDNGPAINAELHEPSGVCVDKFGNVYIADYLNNVIRKITVGTNVITTVAGNDTVGYLGDMSLAIHAEFSGPVKVLTDGFANLYVSDQWNSAIRKVDISTGIITTIAGDGTAGYIGNGGPATNAELDRPGGMYFDKENNLYFAEFGNAVIRRIEFSTQIISTVAGDATLGYSGDGGPATNAQIIPGGVCFDNEGSLLIADYDNHTIRKVYSTAGVPLAPSQKPVSLFPNPAHDELTVQNAGDCNMGVYNFLGQELIATQGFSNNAHINIKELLPGNYMLRIIQADGEVKNTPFVKN